MNESRPHKGNILVVDDNPLNLQVLVMLLTEKGYKARPARNGKLAINSARLERPDLILLDVLMPDLDGYAVCQALKADGQTSNIPIIFISALNQVFDKVKALELGGVDYITKPFQTEEVIARIETQLTNQRLKKQLEEQNRQLQREIEVRKVAEAKLYDQSRALAEFSNNLKELHLLNTRSYQDFKDLFADYLATGCKILGLETGTIGKVENSKSEIVAIYSRQVGKTSPQVTISEPVGENGLGPSPAMGNKKKSELGTPIWVNGEIYGTLDFLAPDEMGKREFNSREREFVRLMAQSLGKIIETEKAETKRQQAEEQLRILERAIAASANGIAIADAQKTDNPIVYVNSGFERITGYSRSEVIGKNFIFFGSTSNQSEPNKLQKAIARGKECQAVLLSRRKDGTTFWNELSISPVRDSNGKLTHFIQIQADISDRLAAEEALARALDAAETANRAKSTFLANVSHELRTPLNGILGYAQILREDKNTTAKQKNGIEIVRQCGEHLLNLINDILDLSKIEADKLELLPTDFHFIAFLEEVVEICRIKAEQKSLQFAYRACPQLPRAIHGDPQRLRQVLLNLLGNAIKFTDRGTVKFTVQLLGEASGQKTVRIRFQIEDTGIGIARKQLTKIFLPFEQVGDKFRSLEGTGLGLAISQKIASLMGSKIQVESNPEVGSSFWFDVDFPSVLESTTSVTTSKQIVGYKGSRKTILIADDRWENRSFLVSLLQQIGFVTLEAENGQEGLNALRSSPRADLIIVDLWMPVMDGLQMTRKLRQQPAFQETIVIATSASSFHNERQKSLECGCNHFILKPICKEVLLALLQNYLHLSWIEKIPEQPKLAASKIVIPPSSVLDALLEAIEIGDFDSVEAEAKRIEGLDRKYTYFATKILQLAREYDGEKILDLIRS